MLRLAFDFIITWRETRTRPNAYGKKRTWSLGLWMRIYRDIKFILLIWNEVFVMR